MTISERFIAADLDGLATPEGWRYEIIDGDLYVSKAPDWGHQQTCDQIVGVLNDWCRASRLGRASSAIGVTYAPDDDVIPDVVWISHARLARSLPDGPDGHLSGEGPELVVEVLSPGAANERRDRTAKLALYSRQAVLEYWIVDWRARSVEVYWRGRHPGPPLLRRAVLTGSALLTSPALLAGFAVPVQRFFEWDQQSNAVR